MKRSITLTILSIAAIFIFSQAVFQTGYSYRAAAPIQRTGSPFDNGGVACNAAGCHTGFSPTNVTGWITSTIPGTGYIPLTTYTITATATFTALVRFGFEISPQTSTGLLAGTNTITDVTNTQFSAGNPKYVTHTITGTNAAATPGTKTWSFNWTAPNPGTGSVTFYGAFNCANNSNTSAGDRIHLTTMVVTEDFTSSMTKPADESFAFSIYPNPASEQINVSIQSKQNTKYITELVDINGRTVKHLMSGDIISGIEKTLLLNIEDVVPGVYFITLKSDGVTSARKIIVL